MRGICLWGKTALEKRGGGGVSKDGENRKCGELERVKYYKGDKGNSHRESELTVSRNSLKRR